MTRADRRQELLDLLERAPVSTTQAEGNQSVNCACPKITHCASSIDCIDDYFLGRSIFFCYSSPHYGFL